MEQLLTEFYELVDRKIQDAWSDTKLSPSPARFTEGLQSLCEKVIHIGSRADDIISTSTSPLEDAFTGNFILYDWMHEAKSFLILWRDVIFEYQKASIFLKEGEIDPSGLKNLNDLSRERIGEAAEYLKNYFSDKTSKWNSDELKEAYLEKQSLRDSPWFVYKEQINALQSQSHILLDQYEKVLKTIEDFDKLEKSVSQIMTSFQSEFERVRSLGDETIEILEKNLTDNPQKIIKHIESIERKLIVFNYYKSYGFTKDQIISEMVGLVDVPLCLENSQIKFKEINFSQAARNWMHVEIRPLIIESQENLDSSGNSIKMALINIKNRISIIVNDQIESSSAMINTPDIGLPITVISESLDKRKEELQVFQRLVLEGLSNNLKVKYIYRNDCHFLDSSQQYLIGQLSLDQSAWIQSIKNWIINSAGFAKGFMANVAEEESLSISEKIMRFVESRKIHQDNSYYNNIFSAQGYIGESFWVGREKEIARLLKLIKNWHAGHRGSAIICGKRLCGKTVFGELICYRYFPNMSIRLVPNSTLRLNGKTLEVREDIEEAIEFIKKNITHEKHLIWIDDLELWQSPGIQASRNVQTLLRKIDTLSSRFFFLVSMSSWFRHHYDQMFGLGRVFQAEINLEYMPEDDIRKVIVIRHGATHKTLVDDEGAEVNPREFKKMVQKITRLSYNNIGDALNLWSCFTERVDENKVIHRPKYEHLLPEFINDENSILLRTILMNKRTNEYHLRKILGGAFRTKYNAIVQRLINLGILKRELDGFLEINENLSNDVALMLQDARYIKIKRK